MLGLGRLVGGQGGFHRGPGPREFDIALPSFGLPGVGAPRLKVSSPEIDRASALWRTLEKALITDPHADLTRKES